MEKKKEQNDREKKLFDASRCAIVSSVNHCFHDLYLYYFSKYYLTIDVQFCPT